MTRSSDLPTGWGGAPIRRPELTEIRAAADWLRGRVVRTPLLDYRGDPTLRVKPEVLQPTGSFKIRGVLHWAHRLGAAKRAMGLSTCSAGNTAQALGFAARLFSVSATAMLPDSVPADKLDAVRRYGVTPVKMPFRELVLYMLEERWRSDPYSYLNPWGDAHMIAGSATIGLEILEDMPDVETVFVPVGGGGLIAGIGSALKAVRPSVRVIAVQPHASPALRACMDAGRSVWIESAPTICDGAAVPVIVDEMAPLLCELVADAVLVSEDDARRAMRSLLVDLKLVAEGAGALALAAALATPPTARGKTVCVISGGSIGADRLRTLLGEASAGAPSAPNHGPR